MIWMQGESDASVQSFATQYQDNLEHFIHRVREDVNSADMPVAIGLIDCLGLCAWRSIVRDAQTAIAESSDSIHMVETEDLGTYPQDG